MAMRATVGIRHRFCHSISSSLFFHFPFSLSHSRHTHFCRQSLSSIIALLNRKGECLILKNPLKEEMGTDDTVKPRRTVFVTVGTTCFDALLKVVNSQEVKDELFRKGCTHLLIQIGRGSYIPVKRKGDYVSLAVDCFTFSSSIADHLRSASLIISHAGSGSIFETLQLGELLIVVANEDLMDNHQSELP